MKLKQKFKKKLYSHEWDSMLRTSQQVMLLMQGVCILIFFFYWDFTKQWLFQLLGAILAFAIAIVSIGMIWLLRLIWSFSDKYKLDYIAQHPNAAKWLKDSSENKTGNVKDSHRKGKA
ncbi:hypothetical protein [Lactobacillus crispatus]|uniref:hypothetical protein n=1 Tax=Lactobacillus crispatus TaxID=47770 RepID=UPI000E056581|nr:hypothetical protein [Lactobacillus crispatus]STX18428.1 Uncharacterised protein [Lactobacillus acidophilus]MCT7730785.1 hypothetical protein [Lactobacillus crispatus]MCT7802153.1 hypothetical protein [Lactobacillus crispatus]MCT7807848.1 hypothetical protein [Lactobacillus crispatus]MCT7816362.1 hypothetical protein [Lactobacillus crispatus]